MLQRRLYLLVDAACHVFNVLGFVLQAAVVVVGLHTGLDLAADGGAQLSAQCAFLGNDQRKDDHENGSRQLSSARCAKRFFKLRVDESLLPHHSFAPLDFLDDRLHIKVAKLGSGRGGQLHRPR